MIEIDSRNIMSRTELGRLLSKQRGREKEAEEVLREAIRIEPKHIQSRTELGRLLSKQRGREKEAEEVLRKSIDINPKDLHARVVLANLCTSYNRPQEARDLYLEVLRFDPGNRFAQEGLRKLESRF